MDTILVTGGAGFIGSNLVRRLLATTEDRIVNIDAFTYAGHESTVADLVEHPRYVLARGDICDEAFIGGLFETYQPRGIMNLAAETHVDRSIDGPGAFISTNINGVFVLLNQALKYWRGLAPEAAEKFRFVHISTDEVYGSLGPDGKFCETTPYAPNSPYAASKACSDHLVRAWFKTYGLPGMVTHCSNNYGPHQFPEKLIPLIVNKALAGEPLPVYGDGLHIREWLYVDDHCSALHRILEQGTPGEAYNIGGGEEFENIRMVKTLCKVLDELRPGERPYEELIVFVDDRPGHDRRYCIDAGKMKTDLDWETTTDLEAGLRATIQWYLDNDAWCRTVGGENYGGQRLGRIEEEAA